MNLLLIPNDEILSKFLKTNFDGSEDSATGGKVAKYKNNYNFSKFFSAPSSIGDSDTLCK